MTDIYEGLTLAQVMGTHLNEEALAELNEDFDEVDFDDVDECGLNPYMGCYDFDC